MAAIALAILLIVTSLARFMVGTDKPLWLDEAWTGVIVTQPSLAGVFRHVTTDVNGPLYSVLAVLWARVSGASDHALRALPTLLGFMAPLIALAPRRLVDKATQYTWCALLACWLPGIWYSQEARPYTLAFALAVANCVAFMAVMVSPSLKAAWAWMVISALLILAHYYGFLLVGFQGAAYLSVHRGRAARTWPAAFALAPVFVPIAFQAHNILSFANPQSSWIATQKLSNLLGDASFVFGGPLQFWCMSLWLPVALVVWLRSKPPTEHKPAGAETALWWVPACSTAAIAAAIGLGFFRPMFISRYLLEFVPGVLLGLAMCATRLARKWETAGGALVALFGGSTLMWAACVPWLGENAFSWETASNALMATHPTRLVFTWDNPMRPDRGQLSDLGGFFFARAGRPIPVDGVALRNGDDPNPLLIKDAAPPGSAILWIYDLSVRGTSAIRFPPAIERLDPRWSCRNFGGARLGIVACDRDWALPAH